MSYFTRAALAALLLVIAAAPAARAQEPAPAAAAAVSPELGTEGTTRSAIGMVVRDPWYEFGTNPRYPAQPNYEAQNRMGQLLAEAGVRWVRIEFIVRQGAGSWEEQVARNDYFVNEVAPRYGLKVMGLLGFALVDVDPRDPQAGLVAKPGSQPDPVYEYAVNPWMKSWLDRALWVMNRYAGRVAAYELLNEQNRLPFIPPSGNHPGYRGGEGIDPEITATLHTKLVKCFRQNSCVGSTVGDPSWRAGVRLILGGLHPKGSDQILPGPRPAQSDRAYLAALYRSAAFKSYRDKYGAYPLDGLGYHPYPAEIVPDLNALDDEIGRIDARMSQVRATLRTLLQASDPAAAEVPFWVTEVGYNAAYLSQNAAGQAAFLRAIYTAMAARGDVATLFWFKYEDFPPATGRNAQQWGIVRIPFTEDARCPGGACYDLAGEPALRRPSFFVLRELAGLPVERIALPMVRR